MGAQVLNLLGEGVCLRDKRITNTGAPGKAEHKFNCPRRGHSSSYSATLRSKPAAGVGRSTPQCEFPQLLANKHGFFHGEAERTWDISEFPKM